MGTENDLPGISLKDEQRQLQNIIGIAQDNLDRAKESVKKLTDDLEDLRDVYEAQDKEGLALWNNATAQLHENERNIVRCEKARKKPYFGRIDFKDPRQKSQESYYIGRVGIAKNASEPVVIDWRAPIASVYYESSLGPCRYTVSSEGTFEIDLNRKRTYEIAEDKLIDFFDSDVVANDELLTKYLAKNKKAVLGEIIATIQKEQNLIIRRSPKTNIIVQGVAGSGKTTVAMHRISYILYNYADDFRPEDFYIIGSNHILLNYITSVLPELDVYGIKQMTMEQLFTRLLYEDWDDKKYSIHEVSKNDSRNSIKGSKEWFEALEKFCWDYEEKCLCTFSQSLERPLENILHFFPVIRVYCLHDLNILCQIHRILSNQQTVFIIYLQQFHIITIYIINGNWSKNIIQYAVTCQLRLKQILETYMLNFSCLNPPVVHIILIIEKYFYFFNRKRLVEEIALTINTAHIQQIVDLVFRLNSLCNHAKSHNICHSGNSLKNSHSLVHGILIHFQELHVNLQNVYIYILQHIQRRISASKIVH